MNVNEVINNFDRNEILEVWDWIDPDGWFKYGHDPYEALMNFAEHSPERILEWVAMENDGEF